MKQKSHLRTFLALTGSSLFATHSAFAVDYYWDANGNTTTATGGTGTWNNSSSLWRDGSSTGTLSQWPNTASNVDTARFAGTAGTITLNSSSVNINVNKIIFGTTGYTIAGPASGTAVLNLSGTTPTIESGVASLNIRAKITGSAGLTKTATGTLTLQGANTGLSGTIDLQAGRLSAGGATANVALGTEFGTGMIDVTSGAYIRFFQVSNSTTAAYANDLTLRGNGNGTGALQNDGNASGNHIIWDGMVTLAADATINAQNSGRYTFNGDIGQSGGSRTLSLTVNGGPHAINAGLTMGTVNHTGSGAVNFGSASVIDVGTWSSAAGAGALNFGTATVTALGTLTTARDTSLGKANQLTASTILNVQGGNFDLGGFSQQSGAFTQTGGTVSNGTFTATSFALNAGTFSAVPGGSGTISFGGGTLQQSNATDHSARFSTAAGQQLRIDVSGAANHVTWATDLTSSGATLAKSGSGTLTLTGNNTYTSNTTVSQGTLLINGSTSTSSAVAANGGTLGGTGTIGGSVSVAGGATLSPGASIESLTTGALSMAIGSTFAYEVANKSATGADLLGVNGALSLSDVTLSLDSASLLALASGAWLVGDKLTLISYGGTAITSGFVGFNDGNNYTFGSNVWTFDYNDTLAGNNFASDLTGTNRITLTAFTVVPEPSTAILASVFLSLGVLRRRRSA